MALSDIPVILWETAFANTFSIAHPLDLANSGSEQRKGTEVRVAPSGIRDAWTVGTDPILEGSIRHIPIVDRTPDDNGNNATGWDGAAGGKAMLEWLLDGNIGRWVPDKGDLGTFVDFHLEEPKRSFAGKETNVTRRRFTIKMVSTGTAFTGY